MSVMHRPIIVALFGSILLSSCGEPDDQERPPKPPLD